MRCKILEGSGQTPQSMSKTGTYMRFFFLMYLYKEYSLCKPVLTSECSFQMYSKSPPTFDSSFLSKEPYSDLCFLTVTGTIQVARRIDRDAGELRQNPAISLEVLVKDRPSGGQENRKQITFIVEDINDNPSTCTKFTFRYLPSETHVGMSPLWGCLVFLV